MYSRAASEVCRSPLAQMDPNIEDLNSSATSSLIRRLLTSYLYSICLERSSRRSLVAGWKLGLIRRLLGFRTGGLVAVDAGAANLEFRAATVVAAALTLEASIIFVALLLVFGKLSSSSVEDFLSFSIKPRLLLVVSPKI